MVQNFRLQAQILLQLNTQQLPLTKRQFFLCERLSNTRTEGNPPHSKGVVDLLKAVKKKEVQKQDAKSMTQHPMVGKEFQNTRKILREAGGNGKRTTLHASL